MGHIIRDLRLYPFFLLSTGNNTLGVSVSLDCGIVEWESSPVGTTTSKRDPEMFDIEQALNPFESIKRRLIGQSVLNQKEIDSIILKELGVNENGIIGVNLAVALSCSIAKAAANYSNKPLVNYLSDQYVTKITLPRIMCNTIGGGGHHRNDLRITEIMLMPKHGSISQNIKTVKKIKDGILQHLLTNSNNYIIGLEGELVPYNISDEDAIEIISKVVSKSNEFVSIGIDIAGMVDFEYANYILSRFGDILYVEDPMSIDNINYYKTLRELHPNCIIAGDDIVGGSMNQLEKHINDEIINSVVIKLNHWGTITRAFEAISRLKKKSIITVASQRSKETGSDIMAHLAVAFGADYLKFGSPVRERIRTYSTLMVIEEINRK